MVVRNHQREKRKGKAMAWSKPKIIEIAVGMEINCYACAELDG